MDTSGYGGPQRLLHGEYRYPSLVVNFITPIAANGGTDYFSLEEPVSIHNITPGVPEASTWVMMIAGFAGIGFIAYRKRGDANRSFGRLIQSFNFELKEIVVRRLFFL